MLVKVGQFSLLALSTLACMAKASPVPAEDVSPRWLNVPDDPSAFKPRGMRDILRRLLPSPSSGSSEPTETATTVSEIAATTTIEVPTPTSISDPVPTPTIDPKIKRAKLFIQNGDEPKYYLSSTLNQAAFATTNQVEGALVFSYDSAQTGLQNFGITGYDKYPVIVATLFEQPLVDGPYDGTTATAFLQPGTAVAAGSTPQHVPTQYDNQVMIETRSESAIFTVGAPDALGKSPVSTSFINPDGKVVKQEVVFTYFPQYQDNTGGFSIAGSTWLDGPFGEFVRPPYRRGQLYLEDA